VMTLREVMMRRIFFEKTKRSYFIFWVRVRSWNTTAPSKSKGKVCLVSAH
jgi:hypothetical protein